jgi:hypothetical protein
MIFIRYTHYRPVKALLQTSHNLTLTTKNYQLKKI